MRLLVLNWQDRTHPQAGGAEVHLHEIFSRMVERGHEVTLYCCSYPGAAATETLDGINVIRHGSRSTFNWTVRRMYMRRFAKERFDIVIDDINKIPFFTPRFVQRPLLAVVHHFFGDSIFNEAGRLAGTYVKYFEDKIGRVYNNTPVCVVSDSTRKECIDRGLLAENITIIHNAIDHTKFPMRVGTKDARPTIVYVGRLKKYKSIDHLIRAVAIVAKTLPTVRLNVLGTGDGRAELERLATSLGLQDHIHFLGFVSDAQKVESLSQAHVVANPSVKEGWGITNIEANACGTPVVSADVPGLRDSVRDGESGLLYPYGNIELLAAHLLRVLVDRNERERLSQGALRWASTFTWERSSREMQDLCERVIANYRPNVL